MPSTEKLQPRPSSSLHPTALFLESLRKKEAARAKALRANLLKRKKYQQQSLGDPASLPQAENPEQVTEPFSSNK